MTTKTRYTASKEFKIACAHRLFEHEGRCINPHGHNYRIVVHASAYELDAHGRVLDFIELKNGIGKWLDENLDHHTIIYSGDRDMVMYAETLGGVVYIMNHNPTAERMAELILYTAVRYTENDRVKITKIEVWETDSSCATVEII